MAKAMLIFDLDEREDIMAHKRAVLATDLALEIFNIQNQLRSMYKSDELSEETYHKILECFEIDIDDILE